MTSSATLIDGTVVPSGSEAWRHETEARHIMTLPKDERRPYLDAIAKLRSQDAVDRLERTMRELWRLR